MPFVASFFFSPNCRGSLSDSLSFIVMEETFHFIFSCKEEDNLNTKCQLWTMLYKPFGWDSQSVSQSANTSRCLKLLLQANTWQIKVANGTSCNNLFKKKESCLSVRAHQFNITTLRNWITVVTWTLCRFLHHKKISTVFLVIQNLGNMNHKMKPKPEKQPQRFPEQMQVSWSKTSVYLIFLC